jgi:hypothetical protein
MSKLKAHKQTPTEKDFSLKDQKWTKTDKANQTPCPMLNILSNYGVLPKRNIDISALKYALSYIRCDSGMTNFLLGVLARYKRPVDNLNLIGKHGFIEHDVSLTRQDFHLGDSISLCKKRLCQLISFSGDGKHLTLEEQCRYVQFQHIQSKEQNPHLTLGISQRLPSTTENALLHMVLRDETGHIRVSWMRYFFEYERFPFNEGYTLPELKFLDMCSVGEHRANTY